jgi:branched-chain amino acid transport system permease protein
MEKAILISLFGLSYGFMLFLVAFAFSIAIGTLGILNVAHGAVFMMGGFVGAVVAYQTGNWLLSILAGAAASGLIALVLGRVFLLRLYKQELQQILLLFGITYILTNVALWIWGPTTRIISPPDLFSIVVSIHESSFTIYRLIVIGIGLLAFFLLWWLQEKTKIGAIIRAGMDDAEMVSVLGIKLRPIMLGALGISSALAGMAAVIASPILGGINLWTAYNILFLSLCVSIIGGVGYVQGTLVGSLLVGMLFVWVASYFPAFAVIATYVALVIVLVVKPRGLLGRTQ